MIRPLVVITISLILAGCGGEPGDSESFQNAEAVRAEIEAAAADTPVPPGTTPDVTLNDNGGVYEPGFGRQLVQGRAMCAWFDYWLTALAAGRSDDAEVASVASDQFSSWDIYIAADSSYTELIDGIIDSARLGDPTPMRQFVENNCALT